MSNTEGQPGVAREILNTWLSPVQAEYAGWEVHQVGKAWMSLAIFHLIVSLFLYLLPGLPGQLSGLPLQHVLYAPVLFILGFLYSGVRSLSIPIAFIFPALILYESYDFYNVQMEKLSADLVYWQIVVAAIWRVLLLLLAWRGIRAALLNARR